MVERLPWEQEAASSILATPTIFEPNPKEDCSMGKMTWIGKMRWRYRLLHAWMALRGFHVTVVTSD